jgi:hypothetical protein
MLFKSALSGVKVNAISQSIYIDVRFQVFILLFVSYIIYIWSRNSVVGIATGYGLDDREVGVRVPVGSRIFSSPRRPERL